MTTAGQCLCGAVRFTLAADPLAVRTCWCRLCQAIGAGSATVNACFPAEALAVRGEVAWYESVADSGNAMRRGFCPRCGTPLFSNALARANLTFVRVGALDDPARFAPEVTLWTSVAPPWAQIDPNLPTFAAQAPPAG